MKACRRHIATACWTIWVQHPMGPRHHPLSPRVVPASCLEVRRCGIVGVFDGLGERVRVSIGKVNPGTDDADEHPGDGDGSNQPRHAKGDFVCRVTPTNRLASNETGQQQESEIQSE